MTKNDAAIYWTLLSLARLYEWQLINLVFTILSSVLHKFFKLNLWMDNLDCAKEKWRVEKLFALNCKVRQKNQTDNVGLTQELTRQRDVWDCSEQNGRNSRETEITII